MGDPLVFKPATQVIAGHLSVSRRSGIDYGLSHIWGKNYEVWYTSLVFLKALAVK